VHKSLESPFNDFLVVLICLSQRFCKASLNEVLQFVVDVDVDGSFKVQFVSFDDTLNVFNQANQLGNRIFLSATVVVASCLDKNETRELNYLIHHWCALLCL